MNQKGFIPIAIIVVGAVAVASAVFGVVKYRDEIVANISEVFKRPKIEAPIVDSTAGDEAIEEAELVEEPIIEEVVEVPAITPPAEPAEPIESVEPEEVEEVGEPEEISEPEEPEEVEEEIEESEEVIEAEPEETEEIIEMPALTISDINVDVSRNPAVISWVTNKESKGLMEYGLVSDFYNSDSISSNIVISDNGFLHTVYLFVEDNTVYHYRVVSIDLDGNRVESEDRTFKKEAHGVSPASLYPSGTPLSYRPGSSVITSHTNNQVFTTEEDDEDGVQITLAGTAEPGATVLIQVNPSYETTADENGNWEQIITLQEGENTVTITVKNNDGESNPTILTFYVEEEGDGYDEGYEDGREDGYDIGEEVGYDIGYWDGYADGYGDDYGEGYYEGYDEGYYSEEGYEEGYGDGYDDGCDVEYGDNYRDGYEEGFEVGYDEGYNDGYYDEGYNDGYNDGADNEDGDGYDVGYDEGEVDGYWDGYLVGYWAGYEAEE